MMMDEATQGSGVWSSDTEGTVSDSYPPNGSPLTKTSHHCDPNRLNLRQLRVELKRMGLSPSGLKAELRRRLKTAWGMNNESPAVSDDETASNIPANPSEKSGAKGEEALEVHPRTEDGDAFMGQEATDKFTIRKRKKTMDKEAVTHKDNVAEKTRMTRRGEGRKRVKSHGSDEEDGTSQESSSRFFEFAALELHRLNQQRYYEEKIKQLHEQISDLREELRQRDQVVDLLQSLERRPRAPMSFPPCGNILPAFDPLHSAIMEQWTQTRTESCI
ncbi:hypothetical protein PROFUN_04103 [Planoprotostelium fungivorum]|uniref:SAP domain-containing protein n=1 Tax=Planoprotostelium fungivorum TaxID=1890364 RepID=A0A2P6NJJ9_9EUKA|nr:hypothetical protein PROFUN_04103 [Planoprotostelium fungivorum]